MSGGVAAHAAYNGSGTQGLAVTNKVDAEEGDVMSVFWNSNDTTRQLLHGSSFTEVHASAGSGTNTFAQSNSHIFDINNDIDCLGDLVLGVTVNHNGQTHPTQHFIQGPLGIGQAPKPSGAANIAQATPHHVNPHDLISIISRVELMIGTQIWQTLESADILALMSTECSSGVYEEYTFQTSGGVQGGKHINNTPSNGGGFFPTQAKARSEVFPGGRTSEMTGGAGHSESVSHTAYIPLKCFTKTLGPVLANFSTQTEDGYLMAAAPHQQVKVRVFTASLKSDTDDANGLSNGDSTTPLNSFTHTGNTAMTVNLALYAKNIIMCNEEREHMRSMPMGIPKRIKMTQNTTKTASAPAANFALDMDLDHFSLFASHLLISIAAPLNRDPLESPPDQSNSTTNVDTAHPGGGFTSSNLTKLNSLNAELLLNSTSFSGKLPLGLLKMNSSSMGLHSNEYIVKGESKSAYVTFVFPLAAIAYGGSSVPLNRFDNIRLRISGDTVGSGVDATTQVSVTCCGETTALYRNGAASLAMY